MKHLCIKPSCGKSYSDNEPDAYYCPSCVKEKQEIAARIDAKRPKTSEPVVSELQKFEQEAKVFTDPNTGRKIFFQRA